MPPESAAPLQIEQAARALDFALSNRQIDHLVAHLALLARWNKAYNLTAIRDPDEMLRQHVVDSLAVVPPLRRHLGRLPANRERRLLDVGSGAGFPGLVLAIAMPDLQVVCIDSVGKKAGFMRQVIAELGLPNAHAVHDRVEALSASAFDVVTSRAYASLADFVASTERHLSPDGVWLAMKGRRPAAEMAALGSTIVVFHVEQVHPPGVDAERCLVWMRRRTSTDPPREAAR